jgi:hypothetical protein
LVVTVASVADESVLAHLQRLVEDAQRDKATLQRMADRISSVFVPAVLIGAIVTFTWWLVVGDPGRAVLCGLAVLLVACPCAGALPAPVAMMVGCGRRSPGIFIRNGTFSSGWPRSMGWCLTRPAPSPGATQRWPLWLVRVLRRGRDRCGSRPKINIRSPCRDGRRIKHRAADVDLCPVE